MGGCFEQSDFYNEDNGEGGIREVFLSNRVDLVDMTGDGLRAGNRTITGLKPNKYYLVQVWTNYGETNKHFEFDGYVRRTDEGRNGRLTNQLSSVVSLVSNEGFLGPDTIIDLENHHENNYTYVVFAARPLTGSGLELWDANGSALVRTWTTFGTSGIEILETQVNHILKLKDIPGANAVSSLPFVGNPADKGIVIEKPKDIIFHDPVPTPLAPRNPDHFTFLYVNIRGMEPPPPPPLDPYLVVSATLTGITPDVFGTNGATIAWSTALPVISQAALLTGKDTGIPPSLAVINLTNSGEFDAGSIRWKYNDVINVNYNSLDLSVIFAETNIDELWMKGTYTFTLEVTKDGIPYSASFAITVGD